MTWGKTAAGDYPKSTNDVYISNGHAVTILSGAFNCRSLRIYAGSGNPKTGGQIIIGDTTNVVTSEAILILSNVMFETTNGKPKERATLRMARNGYLTVSGAITKGKFQGNNTPDYTNNADIFYRFSSTSTIEYSGADQNIFNFYEMAATSTVETATTYDNLTLSGTGTKTPVAGLGVRGNMKVNSGSTFAASTFTHTITGNIENTGTINAASSTINIEGNWSNSGTFTAGTSTIALNGSNKTITSTITGTGAFNNLTVSNGTTSMTTDITVNGELRVENTILQTGTNTLFLGTTSNFMTLETATSHVKGTIQTTRSLSTEQGQTFGNIGVRITSSPSAISTVTVKRVTGAPFVSNNNESVLRQFHITTSDASATGLGTAALEMRFPDYEVNGGSGTTAYDIYRQDLNGLLEKLAGSAATDPQSYNYKLDNAQKFGLYTLFSNMAPLPVELAWFRVARQAKGVQLTWETASEVENSGFEVQVSADGKNFKKVDFVQSRAGNSSVAQRYIYLDTKTSSFGTRYYRLAQIDFDGTTTYSSIKAVTIDGSPVTVAAYPNPFTEGQQVALNLPAGESRRVSLVLTNALGQVVYNEQAQVQEGQDELLVNTAKANAKGIYLLNVIDNGTKYTLKLVKDSICSYTDR
jgi:hypothetical protein